MGQRTAIDEQRLTRDEVAGVRSEVDQQTAQVGRVTLAAQRKVSEQQLLLRLFRLILGRYPAGAGSR